MPSWIDRSLVVVPAWQDIATPPGALRVDIDPGAAFGLGDHPTTMLTLRLLRDVIRRTLGDDPVRLLGCNLDETKLADLDLTGWVFERCSLARTDFGKTELELARFLNCRGAFALFRGANLEDAAFRSSDFNDCTTMCDRSDLSRAVPVASVNSTCWPSGSICGACATSPSLTRTTTSGVPPSADTRMMPLRPWPKRMPSGPQAMPVGMSAWQMVVTVSPMTVALLSV